MLQFIEKTLDNGLHVIVHQDQNTPMATVNLLYKAGSKHESEQTAGIAHFVEHLMFGGSENVPDFDHAVEMAGGSNNAFTTNDYTNYYITIPSANIETALWVESDRMLAPKITDHIYNTQKKVVIEEFKERVYNKPYGDAMHHILEMTYQNHPYKWPTIGRSIEQFTNINKHDVINFVQKFYCPSNAILCIAGNINEKNGLELAEKWFGDVKKPKPKTMNLETDDFQRSNKTKTITANVPANAIYMAFKMPGRNHQLFASYDLLSDIFANGNSSRFIQTLVKEKRYFDEISAHVTGNIDSGLFIIQGKLSDKISTQNAREIIMEQISLASKDISVNETNKVINKALSVDAATKINITNRAMNFAYSKLLGDTNLINSEIEHYRDTSRIDLIERAITMKTEPHWSTLNYTKINNDK